VVEADAALTAAGFAKDGALWIMIETPRAILNLGEIAAAAKATRLSALVLGLNDLAKETRMHPGQERIPFHAAMSLAVIAARAHGLVAIDGVYNHITDTAGFMDECRQALAFGFDGKTLIHPSQIDPCNMIFAPSESEVEHAHAVIAAFALPENAGKGVIKIDGKMTELLHLEQAKRVVAVADAIQRMA
jgi:citrate lyase subunit beta/citryl-CoA lyase